MNFAAPRGGTVADEGDELTYQSYLRVADLLTLQTLRSDPPHPEELHFIVVHQAMELWFKLLLADLERTIGALDAEDWNLVLLLLHRHRDVMGHLTVQLRGLEDMAPASFHEFRSYLGTASGLQSVQFRELELLSGLRDPGYLQGLEATYGGRLLVELAGRLRQRRLADAHRDAAGRLGVTDWGAFYGGDGARSPLYPVTEALVDYDAAWIRWRQDHVLVVQRAIGARARGTGGTALGYLRRTERFRFFPHQWEARDAVADT